MTTELLLQILYSVLIIASITLIAVLWRTFQVLDDLKSASSIINKRTREIDESIGKAKDSLLGLAEGLKAFVYSLGLIKNIKNAIDESNKNKGE